MHKVNTLSTQSVAIAFGVWGDTQYAFMIRISFSEMCNRKSTQRSTLLFSQQYVFETFRKTNEI